MSPIDGFLRRTLDEYFAGQRGAQPGAASAGFRGAQAGPPQQFAPQGPAGGPMQIAPAPVPMSPTRIEQVPTGALGGLASGLADGLANGRRVAQAQQAHENRQKARAHELANDPGADPLAIAPSSTRGVKPMQGPGHRAATRAAARGRDAFIAAASGEQQGPAWLRTLRNLLR